MIQAPSNCHTRNSFCEILPPCGMASDLDQLTDYLEKFLNAVIIFP